MSLYQQENASPEENSVNDDSPDLQTMLVRLHNEAYHCFNSEDVSLSPTGTEASDDSSANSED
jgi:hypothetical protein